MAPIRLVSRDHPYTDKEGRTWAADPYSTRRTVGHAHRANLLTLKIPSYSTESVTVI